MRILIIIPIKGRGFSNKGSTLLVIIPVSAVHQNSDH